MDIVVELEDGGIADVEVQKCGYAFPGQRAACYSADLLLRQYKRVRDELGDKFQYKNIQPVYTIVLMENSSSVFTDIPEHYIHRIKPTSDTGIELELLQTFIFTPLDIFKKKYHNKGIENELDAWLTFLSMDEPEDIIKLITEYPKFIPMYETIYQMCLNLERVMSMYSKELEILDRNTVSYMVDEQQKVINEQQEKIGRQREEIDKQLAKDIEEMRQELQHLKAE